MRSIDYFPGWSGANHVLSNIVDTKFEFKVNFDLDQNEDTVRVSMGRIEYDFYTLVPREYQSVFKTILYDFFKFVLNDRTIKVLNDTLNRYVGQPITYEVMNGIRQDVMKVLNDSIMTIGQHHVSYRDLLKGWLGIPPYHLYVPEEVHHRILSAVTLTRMGVSCVEGEDGVS